MEEKPVVYVVDVDRFELHERQVSSYLEDERGAAVNVSVYAKGGTEFVRENRFDKTIQGAKRKAIILIDERIRALTHEIESLQAQKRSHSK
jgi:hypothetical protein